MKSLTTFLLTLLVTVWAPAQPLGSADLQHSVAKLVHFPSPEAEFSSNRSTIPQKIPLPETKNVLRLSRNAEGQQPLGKTLPEFQFQALSGRDLSLTELRKQSPSGVVLLTFWCTECASCRDTEESLAQITKEFAGKAKVVAVASSKDDTPQTVQAYLDKHKTRIEVLMDPGGEFARHLGVDTTTTSLVLDQTGRVRYYGTLKRGKKFFAVDPLKQVLAKKIVGQPRGPEMRFLSSLQWLHPKRYVLLP